jgi:2-polyprenyl-3-methyl-5-hydroxy-6-metoxy-1,4-benzoquinol methylase
MEKIKQSPEYYDRMFAEGGFEGVYELPYRHSAYFPLFKAVLGELRRLDARSVLEVGCGTGGFAHYLHDESDISYHGFDFSATAVEKARRRTGQPDLFYVGDATDSRAYHCGYDTIVCTEVLEHVERDLDAISNWEPGARCVCSVPNFDSESHVRHFRSEREVVERYGAQIDVERITRIRKPALSDISLRSYARALRWSRYRPRQLAEILGIGSFESLGGWFLFTGARRSA